MQMPPNLKIGGTSVTPLPVTAPSSEFATSLGSVGHRCRSRLCIDRIGRGSIRRKPRLNHFA